MLSLCQNIETILVLITFGLHLVLFNNILQMFTTHICHIVMLTRFVIVCLNNDGLKHYSLAKNELILIGQSISLA